MSERPTAFDGERAQHATPLRNRATLADALVLGAGISGLAAARRLRADGHAVVVLESDSRPGGTLRTATIGGCRFELGPNTVQRTPEIDALSRDAGIEDRLIAVTPAARRRYLLIDGTLVAVPGSPPQLLGTPLLSLRGRLRLLAEMFVRPGPDPEESLADFATRRFGPECVRLMDAMAHGVYAGDPAELAIGHAFPSIHALEQQHGSVFRGAFARERAGSGSAASGPAPLVGYRGGFGRWARDLSRDLDVRYGTTVTRIARDGETFVIDATGPEGTHRFETTRLVSTLPAPTSRDVLEHLEGTTMLRAQLAALPFAPVATVHLVYPGAAVLHPLDGFGFLVPHTESASILGCLFVSSLNADAELQGTAHEDHRAKSVADAPQVVTREDVAPGDVALTVMLGGRRNAALLDQSNEALVELAVSSLRRPLGISAAPVAHQVHRWRPGIPQPTAAWPALQATADAVEDAYPGLTLLGAWRSGPGVPRCIAAGWHL